MIEINNQQSTIDNRQSTIDNRQSEEGYYRTELPAGTYEVEATSDNEDGTTAVAKETVGVVAGERTRYTIYLDKSRFAGSRESGPSE